jgi:hypothetical protein
VTCSEPVTYCLVQEMIELVDVVVITLEVDGVFNRKSPIAPGFDPVARPGNAMRRGHSFYVCKGCGVWLLVSSKQQEIPYRKFIQSRGDERMLADTIQCVAEDQVLAYLRVKERPNSEVVSGAEEAFPGSIPNGKTEIAQQMLYASFAPYSVCPQQELDIRCSRNNDFASGCQLVLKFKLRVYPHICDDPHLPIESKWLMLVFGLVSRLQQRMAETYVAARRAFLSIWPAENHVLRHPEQQIAIYFLPIKIEDSDYTTHSLYPERRTIVAAFP